MNKVYILIVAYFAKGIWLVVWLLLFFLLFGCISTKPKGDVELIYVLDKKPTLVDTVGIDSAGVVHLKFNVAFCFHAFNGEVYSYPCEAGGK